MNTEAQAMWEADAAAQWERENVGNPNESKYRSASYDISRAVEKVGEAVDNLFDSLRDLKGTPAEDKIISLMNDLENLGCDINIARAKLRRGVEL